MEKENKNAESINIMDNLTEFARWDTNKVLSKLKTAQSGLDTFEAELRLEVYGPNQIAAEKPKPWFIQLIRAFVNPFSVIL